MKKPIAAIAVLVSWVGAVDAATVNTKTWTSERAPSYEDRRGRWLTGEGFAYRTYIAVGALVSDFTVDGDFEFGGTLESLPFKSKSFPVMIDNDPIGAVFGWQDSSNHYRFGVNGLIGPGAGGSTHDKGSSLEQGIWLIREENGIDHVLFNDSTYRYELGAVYDFSVGRSGDNIYFSYGQNGTTLFEASVFDTTFMSGRIGVYSESTPSLQANLTLIQPSDDLVALGSNLRPGVVPVPASLPLLAGGLAALGWFRRRQARRA